MSRTKAIMSLFTLFILIFSFFYPSSVLSQEIKKLDIVINEICWTGTQTSSNDEWIELYNNTNSDIKLDGWILVSEDKKPRIELSKKIKAKGFFLLERTDETSVPDIQADQIYTGALNNKGEHLILTDPKANIIDEINCETEWFKGNNETKQTMERKSCFVDGNEITNWQNSQLAQGTPKSQNSFGPDPSNQTNEKKIDLINSEKDNQERTIIYQEEDREIIKHKLSKRFFVSLLLGLTSASILGTFILFLKNTILKQKKQ